ncbi:DNA polymerase III subunit beta (plasmid) [Bacillus methanolicus]|uniref:DNA polymerase III subunit beta n=1 Tax=Bacillus methanolicus TaxID=1471 RepID=UPI0023802168|nr:DNA polymerase III subunit beta [Bacillus methanolicus]MDE3841015.1 DNA polymerase III subunit beta [Bacillus methanolicus]
MHFKIDSQLLSDSLKKVEKVVNAKHSVPIFQGIFMEVTQDEIILIGSDGTESFRYHIPVDGENVDVVKPGKTVLPKQVSEIAKKLKKELEIKLTDFNLTIKYGKKSEFSLNTFDPEEYPKLPTFDIEKPTLNLKGTDFNAFIKKTVFAAADSELRPILTGVYLSLEGDCMTLVSTDSHRLGQVKTKTTNEKSLKLVIPAKALDKLVKTFDLQEDVCVYCESDNQVIFKNGALFFYSRLLDGNYPDTSRLIPNNFKAEMKIKRKELLDSLDRISGLANGAENGKGGVVNLHVNGVATISTHQSQIGKGVEVVDYEELTGEDDFTISFSAKYMIDALKAIDDDLVNFKYQGNMRPFLITPCQSDFEEIQLVLPVRTV